MDSNSTPAFRAIFGAAESDWLPALSCSSTA